MKIIPAAFASLALLANAWAARDADFSEFKGTYRGSGTIVAYGYSYPLTAAVKFAVAKSGKTAKATLSGEISAMGTVPWATTIRLQRKRKASTNSLFGSRSGRGNIRWKGEIPNPERLETGEQDTPCGDPRVRDRPEIDDDRRAKRQEEKETQDDADSYVQRNSDLRLQSVTDREVIRWSFSPAAG